MLNTLQHTIQVMSDLYQEAPGRGINKSRQDKKWFPIHSHRKWQPFTDQKYR